MDVNECDIKQTKFPISSEKCQVRQEQEEPGRTLTTGFFGRHEHAGGVCPEAQVHVPTEAFSVFELA